MSDEMKNMNDINDQQTAEQTEQQSFSEEIRRRLAEPDSGKPTLEEFKVMVYKDREKRRKKRNTMVACVIAAFVVGLFSFEYLVPEVGADKNPKETIVTEGGVIIEDGGYGSSEEDDNVWMTEDWDQVEDARMIVPEILIPRYVPKEYVFEKLKIELLESGATTCTYAFVTSKGNSLEIESTFLNIESSYYEVNDISYILECSKGKIYITENKIATIQMDDGSIINIWSMLANNEIKKIVENLSN